MVDTYKASELHFCGGQTDHAKALVIDYHYSKRVPGSITFVGSFHLSGGLFGDQGEMLAAAFFSIPPTRWSEPVIELTRLVRKDGVIVPLSRLISLSLKELKRRGYDLVVSFADTTQGHEGYIYQACSWNYNGIRDKQNDGMLIDGAFVPRRSCYALYGTSGYDDLCKILPHKKIEKHYDEGKHLYWKTLNRNGDKKAEKLSLERNPYPKGEKCD